MVELMTILGQYRDDIVLVGGHVPPLLIPSAKENHPGSLDIDLALDIDKLPDRGYGTIVKLLETRGYYQSKDGQPFIYYRDITGEHGRNIRVEVDLLAGEYGGTDKGHRTQKVQDAKARKARGCDLVFQSPIKVRIKSELPDGGENEVTVKVASVGPFLVTKGMALFDRLKEKDAYDIYYCCRYFPGGVEALAEEIKPLVGNHLAKEGLGKIKAKFCELKSIGPVAVVNFMEIDDQEERDRIQRDAYEYVNKLMELIKVKAYV